MTSSSPGSAGNGRPYSARRAAVHERHHGAGQPDLLSDIAEGKVVVTPMRADEHDAGLMLKLARPGTAIPAWTY